MAPIVLDAPRAEHHPRDRIGIGERRPRLSWTVAEAPHGWVQEGYEVQVVQEARGGALPPWESGRIDGGDSVLVPWPAPPLASRDRRAVRVRVWGTGGGDEGPSPWSPPLTVEAGLLAPGDWTAVMVGPDGERDPGAWERTALLRGGFELPAPPAYARLYATARGLYELELNGDRVGDEVLSPGWTSYRRRLRYSTYDVTDLLHAGPNVLGAHLADGWFRGRIGYGGGTRDVYGERTGLLAQLEVVCGDGTTVRFGTGPGWQFAPGPALRASLYDGEHHDARLEPAGWSRPPAGAGPAGGAWPGTGGGAWRPVRGAGDFDPRTLRAPTGPPVRHTQDVEPVAVTLSPSGRTILDFGQNLVGRLRLRLRAGWEARGTEVTLRHAEVLQDGELCVRPLRRAEATDRYALAGHPEEVWEPRFTFHGFRYAEIEGWPGELDPADVTARVIGTDLRRTGWFACSDEDVDRLHENVVWSMRGNFVDVPTDCPQRDERLGWTGDIQVFTPTAAFLHDCAGMLASWLGDLAADQYADGTVPLIVPEVPTPEWLPAWPMAVWGDAAVLMPWELYRAYGDEGLLRDRYGSARAWVDRVLAGGTDGSTGRQLGDWLDPAAPPDDPWAARTDAGLVAAAYAARSSEVLARIAGVLGEDADAERYRTAAAGARERFRAAHVTAEGRLTSDSQTAYALALVFDLLPPAEARAAGRRLAELVAADGHHIATGFAGTPVICEALTRAGATEDAYRLLLQRECPSWLYPVTRGATTVWERWDSLLPDGTVNPGEMTSFNHYALGAVADWLHGRVAGLAPAAPGWRRIRVAPRPGGGLTWARARHDTPYGTAEVRWRLHRGRRLDVEFTVPVGTTAEVDLPGLDPYVVGPGGHRAGVDLPAPPPA
ncbi:family 78 glycoside hydrolase catalytic domain [Streptomyces fuscigenes]|uniref:family 78 glycoside hydrolase catalytic domain n=1 Tax=Streptomyces fuscigenes TaxID=1528880 RepID=UPI001F25C1E2|nr:family 78 glycoside hydrolase catalytic domain [Streptomyces fuscigenes]MCF3961913.1 glycoside hydrolase family 78 protein [Streptomyces fuscigenes]